MLFIKKFFVIILVIVFASCAENKNIPISGADVTSESNIEEILILLMKMALKFQYLII